MVISSVYDLTLIWAFIMQWYQNLINCLTARWVTRMFVSLILFAIVIDLIDRLWFKKNV